MRTTLDLPEDLIKKAMSLHQIKTKTQVITTALQEMIRKSEISDLKNFKGKVDLKIDLNTLRATSRDAMHCVSTAASSFPQVFSGNLAIHARNSYIKFKQIPA